MNAFGARVEKVADLDCLEGPYFQVVQTIVCVLQSQLGNNSEPDSLPGFGAALLSIALGFFRTSRK